MRCFKRKRAGTRVKEAVKAIMVETKTALNELYFAGKLLEYSGFNNNFKRMEIKKFIPIIKVIRSKFWDIVSSSRFKRDLIY
jgi:hypothetical protein